MSDKQSNKQIPYGLSSLDYDHISTIPTIALAPGTYFGLDNKGIDIDFQVNIISLGGASDDPTLLPIIDCQSVGYGIKVTKTDHFSLTNIGIVNCNANLGAGLYILNSNSFVTGCLFIGNRGDQGSAIGAVASTLDITFSKFVNNGILSGSGAYLFLVGNKFDCTLISCEGAGSVIKIGNGNDEKRFNVICNDGGLLAKNLSVQFQINNKTIMNSSLEVAYINSTKSVPISSNHLHTTKVLFWSTSKSPKSLSLWWKFEGEKEYSLVEGLHTNNVCGDGVLDPQEKLGGKFQCHKDAESLHPNLDHCGDGLCTENPDDCFADCHYLVSKSCPSQVTPAPVPDNLRSNDTINSLLSNQYLYTLPGISTLTHGVNFFTEKISPSPVFSINYCDSFSTLHDLRRFSVYAVPPGFDAYLSPTCTFGTTSTIYGDSSDISSEMSRDSSVSAGFGVGGSYDGVGGAASYAFSLEESVKTSKDLEQQEDVSVVSTEIICITSKVIQKEIVFHQLFLQDLAMVNDSISMLKVILKYGNLYIKQASLGGKLRQMATVANSFFSTKSDKDVASHASTTMGATLKAPMFQSSGSVRSSNDNQYTQEEQSQYRSNSQTSTIISYGGSTDIIGPDRSMNQFAKWASTKQNIFSLALA
eukprot:gene18225-21802_t